MRPSRILALLALPGPAFLAQDPFETTEGLRKLEADRGSVDVFAGGRRRTLPMARARP